MIVDSNYSIFVISNLGLFSKSELCFQLLFQKNTKVAKYDDINETSKNIPDLEFCGKEQTQTLDNIKVGVS